MSLPAHRVTRVLSELVALHGAPGRDSSPALLAQVFVDWRAARGIGVHYYPARQARSERVFAQRPGTSDTSKCSRRPTSESNKVAGSQEDGVHGLPARRSRCALQAKTTTTQTRSAVTNF